MSVRLVSSIEDEVVEVAHWQQTLQTSLGGVISASKEELWRIQFKLADEIQSLYTNPPLWFLASDIWFIRRLPNNSYVCLHRLREEKMNGATIDYLALVKAVLRLSSVCAILR